MEFKGKIIVAPLAGITDRVFRSLCRECGADVVVSEMISADGIRFDPQPSGRLGLFGENERPIGIQLFGGDPERLGEAAAYVEQRFAPDFIDLNAGCPVRKVIAKNGGAALLRDRRLFERIVSAMVAAVKTPVTVKIRSGWRTGEWVDVEFARAAQGCGAAAVTLHPRSKTMAFAGAALWERIALVKQAVSVPVIGNGDVRSAADVAAMLAQTGCDAVMIGRAALGNPWIFGQCRALLSGAPASPVTPGQGYRMIMRHIDLHAEAFGECRACREMKKHIGWYVKGTAGASAVRNAVNRAPDVGAIRAVVTRWYESVAQQDGAAVHDKER